LRGRTIKIEVLPLNFKEFLKFKGFKIKDKYNSRGTSEILRLLKEYMKFGGFPEVCLYEEKEKILKEYLDDIFYKDVVERFKIRDLKGAKVLRNILVNLYSSEISVKNITNILKIFNTKISRETIYNYLEYFEESYFIFLVNKFSYKISEQIRNSKLYLIDGIWSLSNKHSQNYGKIFENVVFLELRKHGKDVYYYKNDYEIDFITDDSLIQVCYELNEQNIEREVKALKKYKSNKKKYIITFNQFDEVGDIKVVPFWYFSLFYL
jgi:predicted AAA+ superfamily ATPase